MKKKAGKLADNVASSAVALRVLKGTLRGARADWRLARGASALTKKTLAFLTTAR